MAGGRREENCSCVSERRELRLLIWFPDSRYGDCNCCVGEWRERAKQKGNGASARESVACSNRLSARAARVGRLGQALLRVASRRLDGARALLQAYLTRPEVLHLCICQPTMMALDMSSLRRALSMVLTVLWLTLALHCLGVGCLPMVGWMHLRACVHLRRHGLCLATMRLPVVRHVVGG